MRTVTVKMDSLERISRFNKILMQFDCDFDLEQGRFYIDGKSMLGIVSLDLSAPIRLHFQAEEEEEQEILRQLEEYLVK